MRAAAALALATLLVTALAGQGRAALVAEYNFNETSGTTVAPTVGSVSGTLTGAASFVSGGIDGGAVSLARAGGGLVNFGPNLFPSGPFSVQIWVETTDTTSSLPLSYQTSGVVGVYNGNTSSIYVDGKLQSSSAGGNPLLTEPAADFLLGGIMEGPTPTNDFQGELSDLQIYNNALSASNVLALYDAAIPEPGTLALLGAGLFGIGMVRRRSRT